MPKNTNQIPKRIWQIIAIVFSFLALGLLIHFADSEKLLETIKRVSPFYLLAAIPICLVMLALKSYRWHNLLGTEKSKLSFFEVFSAFNAGIFWGLVTPGRVGEVIRVSYLKRYNIPIRIGIYSLVVDRLLDMAVLTFLVFVSLFSVTTLVFDLWLVFMLASSGVLIAIGLVYLFRRHLYLLGKFVTAKLFRRYATAESYTNEKISEVPLPSTNVSALAMPILISFASWAVYFLMYWMMAHATSLNIGNGLLAAAIFLSAFAAFIPISVAGIGTRDALFLLIMTPAGVQVSDIVAFSLTFIYVYFIVAIISVISWLFNPLKPKLYLD